ncbi:MAG: aminoacyl-tRNA hydrolase [Fibrobacter sp.]|jgi:PTH1 family peptidyl-tRNA hydrolase|nr:aminoacyl-tRNA hydrolase [Fibrobacter sp.]
MYLMVGLGNPGREYEQTRHNAGFLAIDTLADSSSWKTQGNSLVQKKQIGKHEVILAKPQTFMNLSGGAVQSLLSWYKIPVSRLLVFSDDVNLDAGRIRIRPKGSHGGQNGLRDIIARIGDDFARVRLGVGKPPLLWDLADFVLSKFTPEDKTLFSHALNEIPKLAEVYLSLGINVCMDRYNGFQP